MEYIYHYTSAKSLLGLLHTPTNEEKSIISDSSNNLDYGYYLDFHAGAVNLMNDELENKLVKDIFRKIPKCLYASAMFVEWTDGELYAVSFSTKPDYIPMWRIYADDYSGICLKIQRKELEYTLKKINNESFVDVKAGLCLYLSKSEFRKKLRKVLSEIVTAHDKNIKSGWLALSNAFVQSAFCKLKTFEYEKEYRLAAFVNKDFYIKQGRYGLSLYYPIKVPLRFLKEIIIGPSPYQDALAYSISTLIKSRLGKLDKYGINVKVSKSHLKIR